LPELPEVETVARQLQPLLAGRTIRQVQVLDSKIDAAALAPLAGRRIAGARRIGKQVAIEIEAQGRRPALWLSVHLRMTGRLIWQAAKAGGQKPRFVHDAPTEEKHLRAVFVTDGGELRFYDLRRFGVIGLYSDPGPLHGSAVDPLGRGFSTAVLAALLSGARGELKPWLLRQDRIGGIGNIYASEILFAAGIHPQRTAGSLSDAETAALRRETVRILKLAVKHCGTTFSDFQDSRGEIGDYARFLKVYNRAGQACPRCGAAILRLVQQQRSTFCCAQCQE
jgi:formamidopyrimidine-DNA glycosylase